MISLQIKHFMIFNKTCLLTGDGLIVVFRGIEQMFLPLKLSLSVLKTYEKTRKKELRLGINCGPVRWIKMTDGTTQVIGHALNWAVRVMSAAQSNQVFVSDIYHNQIIIPSKSEFSGVDFSEVKNLKTKKGEPIAAYRVVVTNS